MSSTRALRASAIACSRQGFEPPPSWPAEPPRGATVPGRHMDRPGAALACATPKAAARPLQSRGSPASTASTASSAPPEVTAHCKISGREVTVLSDNNEFAASLRIDTDASFVLAPQGFLAPKMSPGLFVFDTVVCQMCDADTPFDRLTRSGQMRAFRRVCRWMMSASQSTVLGKGRVICRECADQPACSNPKTYLTELARSGAVAVTVGLWCAVEDQGHAVVKLERVFRLGQDNQRQAECDMYAAVARKVRFYWENTNHPMDQVDPNVCEMDTDQGEDLA
jgi:hypothetical protein